MKAAYPLNKTLEKIFFFKRKCIEKLGEKFPQVNKAFFNTTFLYLNPALPGPQKKKPLGKGGLGNFYFTFYNILLP